MFVIEKGAVWIETQALAFPRLSQVCPWEAKPLETPF